MIRLTVLLATLVLAASMASAQWQWIDGAGRRVFSDQAPPPDVPQKNILRQPGRTTPAPEPGTPAATPATAAVPAAPRAAGRDPELEKRRQQAEAAEAEKKKAEEERIAKLRSENCTRARQAKATLDSGIRLARVNKKGEREILDDAARGAELRRLDEVIASDCKS